MKIVNIDDQMLMIDRWILDDALDTLVITSENEPLMLIAHTDGGVTKRYIFMEVPGVE